MAKEDKIQAEVRRLCEGADKCFNEDAEVLKALKQHYLKEFMDSCEADRQKSFTTQSENEEMRKILKVAEWKAKYLSNLQKPNQGVRKNATTKGRCLKNGKGCTLEVVCECCNHKMHVPLVRTRTNKRLAKGGRGTQNASKPIGPKLHNKNKSPVTGVNTKNCSSVIEKNKQEPSTSAQIIYSRANTTSKATTSTSRSHPENFQNKVNNTHKNISQVQPSLNSNKMPTTIADNKVQPKNSDEEIKKEICAIQKRLELLLPRKPDWKPI